MGLSLVQSPRLRHSSSVLQQLTHPNQPSYPRIFSFKHHPEAHAKGYLVAVGCLVVLG